MKIYLFKLLFFQKKLTYQEIRKTKIEVGIRFWAPNLGLSPKYDQVTFYRWRTTAIKFWEENYFKEKNINGRMSYIPIRRTFFLFY